MKHFKTNAHHVLIISDTEMIIVTKDEKIDYQQYKWTDQFRELNIQKCTQLEFVEAYQKAQKNIERKVFLNI